MQIDLNRLPGSIKFLTGLVGEEAALALVLAFGGRSIWPHSEGAGFAALAEVMGEPAARKFVAHYREEVSIPKCDAALRAAVRLAIRTEFDRLTRAGLSARAAVAQLAGQPPYRYTDRHVWRVLGRVDEGQVVGVGQAELF